MSKYLIPDSRIPKPFNQNKVNPYSHVDSCVACTFTKILEVINYVKTGTYTDLSKGYMYGRNNYPDKKKGGMNEEYTLNVLLKRGSVPEKNCADYDEIPDIVKKLESRKDIAELDILAESFRLKAWENLSGNNSKELFENVKAYLKKYNMPLAATIKNYGGERHCVVAVGYDGEKILWQNHDGTDKIRSLKHTEFCRAYYLDGNIEEAKKVSYKLMNTEEFKKYIDGLNISRKIKTVQLHHTYAPSYDDFTGENHIKLQDGMREYHMKSCGFNDIAQTFTIFPDGKICTGRDINKAPAGIYGANSDGVCIECLGNFNGTDKMTEAQENAIVAAVRILLDKLSLNARENVTYHAWWTSIGTFLGDYIKDRSCKTCPGTSFFGGNTRAAYEKNLMPLIENYKREEKKTLESANDITWELNHTYFPIDDAKRFVEVLEKARKENSPLYWGYYKLVNRIKQRGC